MSHYDTYFKFPQLGGGIGPLYRAPIYVQRGRGLGSAFKGFLRLIFPSIKSAGSALLKEAASAGLNVLSQHNSAPMKEILKSQAKKSFSNLSLKAEDKLKRLRNEMQTGSGSKRIKRDLNRNSGINNSLMALKASSKRRPRRKVKRKARKSRVLKKNRVKKGRVSRKKKTSKASRSTYLKKLFNK